jgi:hypothetical protein
MARLVLTSLALSLLMAAIVGVVSYLRARSSLESQRRRLPDGMGSSGLALIPRRVAQSPLGMTGG